MAKPESFWDFSLRSYAAPGVAEACIALQDSHGADVNLLLFGVWVAHTRGEYDDPLFAQMLEFSESWRKHVVGPLRGARSWLKPFAKQQSKPVTPLTAGKANQLREQIKTVELAAEKLQQETLESLCAEKLEIMTMQDEFETAIKNTQRYCKNQSIPLNSSVRTNLSLIICAGLKQDRIDWVANRLAGL